LDDIRRLLAGIIIVVIETVIIPEKAEGYNLIILIIKIQI